MAEMISVREAAMRWNITERRVATLCKNGRIAGAEKQGNRWLIPADTQKPADQRLKTGAFRKTERAPKLPLPIGVSNYCLASSEYYYIDKTMMIKDFIDERPMVTLFTVTASVGTPFSSQGTAAMASSTSMPAITWPNTVSCPSR